MTWDIVYPAYLSGYSLYPDQCLKSPALAHLEEGDLV